MTDDPREQEQGFKLECVKGRNSDGYIFILFSLFVATIALIEIVAVIITLR